MLPLGNPVTTCPFRFEEGGLVRSYIGSLLLDDPEPEVVKELPFLRRREGSGGRKELGRIDNVLVSRRNGEFWWCPLEFQAVYFSGSKMEKDFEAYRAWTSSGAPRPAGKRRPDFRSSGPKRLMPQLEAKVPTLSRWGKKMAVVEDEAFWNSQLAGTRVREDMSSSEIIWIVVGYSLEGACYSLRPVTHYLTTLTDSVASLTGGEPVSKAAFEDSIRVKLDRGEAKPSRRK
jgi:hypothetical protein